MTCLDIAADAARKFYSTTKRHACKRIVLLSVGGAFGAALFGSSPNAIAQITQGNGSSQQENRTSTTGEAQGSSAPAVHESYKPQTKDGASANSRGKTTGQGNKTQGAGGFENGLYGTGAGSNK